MITINGVPVTRFAKCLPGGAHTLLLESTSIGTEYEDQVALRDAIGARFPGHALEAPAISKAIRRLVGSGRFLAIARFNNDRQRLVTSYRRVA